MSDSVRPHRRQPTRLPRPWDSPGKNTGVGCHFLLQCMKVKSESEVVQSCPTISNPMNCSLPGSSVHGIFQARVLEWKLCPYKNLHTVAHISFIHNCQNLEEPRHPSVHEWINCGISRQWNIACMRVWSVSSVMFGSATLWTIAHQTPLSMGFSRQEYWSGLPCPPPPGDLPDPGIKPTSALQADSLSTEPPGKPQCNIIQCYKT